MKKHSIWFRSMLPVVFALFFGILPNQQVFLQPGNGNGGGNANGNGNGGQNLPPFVKVPYKEMLRMVAKYRDERQAVINQEFSGGNPGQYGVGFADSRYFTLELDKVKSFIAAIEDQIKENRLNVEFTGLRIYPMVYPAIGQSDYSDDIPASHRNHQTIMLVPTFSTEGGDMIDFDPDLFEPIPGTNQNRPKSLFKPMGMSEEDFLNWLFGINDPIRAFSGLNYAGLCPPPNPCTTSSLLYNADVLCPPNTCPY
ncbi:MAG: hypothetical protein KBF37_11670 [Saprospiraceae bacterium]|jgi:hypothetical protein|nr:hypothetical protein [Saprospiraceae bacterium]MBV6472864.1 hypothetical protein [Saprospiraceae bacterium]